MSAQAIPLKLLSFLKRKHAELTDLVAFFQKAPPPDHGLHGYISPQTLEKGAAQLAFHTFCCYVLLKPHLALLDIAYLSTYPSSLIPPWATRATLTDIGIALLEEEAPWLSTEIKLAVRGILGWNLLLQPTCAPEQLITQWYLEQLFTGLELLRASALEPTAEDVEGVRGVFEEGENLLARQAALRA
jgi:hypothetical protein